MFSSFNTRSNVTAPQKVILIACGSFNPVTNMHLRMFELGRDALHRTGRFRVIGGIISPVSDGYQKKDLVSVTHRCNMVRLALKTSNWIRLDTWESEQPCWLETEKVLAHHWAQLCSQHNSNGPVPSPRHRKNTHSSSEDFCLVLVVRLTLEKGRGTVRKDPLTTGKVLLTVGKTTTLDSLLRAHKTVWHLVDHASPPLCGGEDQVPVVRLLCGADLLESFGTPGLWAQHDIEKLVGRYGLVCVSRAGSNPQKFIYESDLLSKYQENITIVTEWMINDISATKVRRALRRGESVKYLLADSVIDYIREHQLYGAPDNKYINHLMPSPNGENHSPETEEESTSSSSGDNARMCSSSYSCSSHSMDVSPSGTSAEQSSGHGIDVSPCCRSVERGPVRRSPSGKNVACMTDIRALVPRVKNLRIVYTPETCV